MDSGNSGSLQSSSGGDEEFDSRGGGGGVDSSPLSALLRQSPSAAFSLHGSYFGLQEFTSPPPPQQQAGAWSGSFAGSASGLPSSSSPRVAAQPPPRGSRKRTRASRRAPTTVLTTDTSNFRAMVQEFTGIPSPPFGAGVGGVGLGASLRTRFDHIFPPPSSSLRAGAGVSDAAAASLPPYLLRPFPHKLPTSFPPFTSPSSSSSPTAPSSSSIGATNANAATGAATNTTAAAPSNPAAPTAAGNTFQHQLTSSALLRMQQDASSYLSFQNLLDSSQSIFGGAAGGFAPSPSSRLHDPAPSPSDFLAGVGGGSLGLSHGGGLLGSEGPLHLHHSRSDAPGHGHGGDELSGVVAAGASGGASCKLNYSSHSGAAATTSSAAAGADKPPDGGGGGAPGRPGRSDGLDPWICTSE
ncbi:unnamed protein product [Urochloa decumbens]|uniref:VQ domain-containing protein n=1 Tax=Urochloa decumbens TaxID=240449 RepID=A0ABC9EWP5_9POAL